MPQRSTVHLVRHGEVENPTKVLYGRLPHFHLSDNGQLMAVRIRDYLAPKDVVQVVSSPLERAVETATPLARELGMTVATDERLIEAANVFEGQRVGVGDGVLRSPGSWRHLYNPIRPSWGEPYRELAARMRAAIDDAKNQAPGEVTVIVSHQLPIWIARLDAERRRFWHDPRRRECSLGSITTLHFTDDEVTSVTYHEPCADLLPTRPGRGA